MKKASEFWDATRKANVWAALYMSGGEVGSRTCPALAAGQTTRAI